MGNEAELMPLSVTLTMNDDMRSQLRQGEGAIGIAEAFEIDSPEMAIAANNELRMIKERLDRVETLRKSFISPAQQIIANANMLFNPAREALASAESLLKNRIADYQAEERKKADEIRRQAEEQERRLRQEADQRAAAARAKAEADAREARKRAAEAEAAAKRLAEEGKKRQAATAAADAARLQEQAAAAIENGEAKAQQIELSAAAMPAAVIPEPTKLAGFSMRENWVAEFEQGHDDHAVLQKIAAALPARPELIGLLKLDMTAVGKMAKALKKAFSVPGLVARNVPVAASRR